MSDDPAFPIAMEMIARWEGFRSEPYQDLGGTWTIGYGFTALPGPVRVTADAPAMSEAQAQAFLAHIVEPVLARVRMMVHRDVSTNAIAALTDFAYNEGTGALSRSALLAALNAGDDLEDVALRFGSWVYVKGAVSSDLVKRRAAERELFLTPDGGTVAQTADQLNEAELKSLDGDQA